EWNNVLIKFVTEANFPLNENNFELKRFCEYKLSTKIIILKNLCLKALYISNYEKYRELANEDGTIEFSKLIGEYYIGERNRIEYYRTQDIRIYSYDLILKTWKAEITSVYDIEPDCEFNPLLPLYYILNVLFSS
ncbi:hypothetical protein PIROE2DRAFT_3261, partial [Piromyces sp. E2]